MATSVSRRVPKTAHYDQSAFSCKTILFNCNCHSFEDVETQLIKAIHCTLSRARAIAWKVHTAGSEVVYSGHKERCEAVAEVLAAVGLIVKID